jgi:predicted nuclease with TOPRIM domain
LSFYFIAFSHTELAQLRENLSRTAAEASLLTTTTENLNELLASLRRDHAASLAQTESRVSALENESTNLTMERNHLLERVSGLEEDVVTKDARIAVLESKNSALRTRSNELESGNNALRSEVAQRDLDLSLLRRNYEHAELRERQEKENLRISIQTLRAEGNSMGAENKRLRAENEHLRAEYEHLRAEYEHLRVENVRLGEDNHRLRQERRERKERHKARTDDLEQEIARLRSTPAADEAFRMVCEDRDRVCAERDGLQRRLAQQGGDQTQALQRELQRMTAQNAGLQVSLARFSNAAMAPSFLRIESRAQRLAGILRTIPVTDDGNIVWNAIAEGALRSFVAEMTLLVPQDPTVPASASQRERPFLLMNPDVTRLLDETLRLYQRDPAVSPRIKDRKALFFKFFTLGLHTDKLARFRELAGLKEFEKAVNNMRR